MDESVQGHLLPQVTVIDAIMGAGKTHYAMQMLAGIGSPFNESGESFIYITPFLDEVERVKDTLARDNIITHSPVPVGGSKLNHLTELVIANKNIVSTHALFAMMGEGTLAALDESRYTLVIDEVTDWVHQYQGVKKADIGILFKSGQLSVDAASRHVVWTDPADGYQGHFNELRALCMQDKIVAGRLSKNDSVPVLLLWELPTKVLARFRKVIILTYMFEGSEMMAYMKINGVGFDMMALDSCPERSRPARAVPYAPAYNLERLRQAKALITIVEGRSNAIGTPDETARDRTGHTQQPMSVSWFENDPDGMRALRLKSSMRYFFRDMMKAPAKSIMWSTFKAHQKALSGPGWTGRGAAKDRCFVQCREKATNKYNQRTTLAYCLNLYHHPFIRSYFQDRNYAISADFFALSAMVQWIWRSAIRDGKPITVYVPAERMRNLLKDWLEGKVPEASSMIADNVACEAA